MVPNFFTAYPFNLSSTPSSTNPNFGLVAERLVPKLLWCLACRSTCRNSQLIQMCNTELGSRRKPAERAGLRRVVIVLQHSGPTCGTGILSLYDSGVTPVCFEPPGRRAHPKDPGCVSNGAQSRGPCAIFRSAPAFNSLARRSVFAYPRSRCFRSFGGLPSPSRVTIVALLVHGLPTAQNRLGIGVPPAKPTQTRYSPGGGFDTVSQLHSSCAAR